MLQWIIGLIAGPVLDRALDGWKAKLAADGDRDKIAGDLVAREVALAQRQSELQAAIVQSEQGNWLTRSIRPLFALPVAIYYGKLFLWDKVLGLGSTDPLGPDMATFASTVVAAYFGGRTVEIVAKTFMRGR